MPTDRGFWGQRLWNARHVLGWPPKDVANFLNVSINSLYAYEKKYRTPSKPVQKAISHLSSLARKSKYGG